MERDDQRDGDGGGSDVDSSDMISDTVRTADEDSYSDIERHRTEGSDNEQKDNALLFRNASLPIFSSAFSRLKENEIVYRRKKPKKIRQYLIGDMLGRGSYAKVKEAMNLETRKRVAVKIVQLRQVRKIPGGMESVEQEVETLRALPPHRNVCSMAESFRIEDKKKLYMILQYVGGGSLSEMMSREGVSTLPTHQSRGYFTSILDALHHVHTNGFVHRDVKPANLMLALDGSLVLSDFGCAEPLAGFESKNSKSVGTPAFQPPEVAAGREGYCPIKADMWAVGITLYHMATGMYPFGGPGMTVYRLFELIAKGDYVEPDFIKGTQVADLIAHLLDPAPETRYGVEEARRHEWMTMDVDESIAPVPVYATPSAFRETSDGFVEPLTVSDCSSDDEERHHAHRVLGGDRFMNGHESDSSGDYSSSGDDDDDYSSVDGGAGRGGSHVDVGDGGRDDDGDDGGGDASHGSDDGVGGEDVVRKQKEGGGDGVTPRNRRKEKSTGCCTLM
eukprot:TRINITY_DN4649_c1_g1_i1.p1 TRINITY_DN4649_c1_g1~~TRINITY_DN4649_c1_g1_i1.p1  ORF type:complete len:504 (+),score=115.96 TRINITY_DN4649_c1_g1_i1:443-1954(+)